MDHPLCPEDTCLHHVEQANALIDYVRRAGLNALNEYQQDKMLNLTTRQGLLLTTVARMTKRKNSCITLSCLARELHMSVSALSHLADTLEELNLLTRSAHEDDRRSVCLTLSAAGQRCADTAKQGMLKAISALTSHLTPEENALRLKVMNKLYNIAFPGKA